MHELKKAQVERQFLLRDPPMGAQPRAWLGPETFGGVDVDLVKTVSIVVAGVFPSSVADRPMIEPHSGKRW